MDGRTKIFFGWIFQYYTRTNLSYVLDPNEAFSDELEHEAELCKKRRFQYLSLHKERRDMRHLAEKNVKYRFGRSRSALAHQTWFFSNLYNPNRFPNATYDTLRPSDALPKI